MENGPQNEKWTLFHHYFVFRWMENQNVPIDINLQVPELFFFLILAHSVYKMWIIQEPNTLELWNKLHFEEKKKTKNIYHV